MFLALAFALWARMDKAGHGQPTPFFFRKFVILKEIHYTTRAVRAVSGTFSKRSRLNPGHSVRVRESTGKSRMIPFRANFISAQRSVNWSTPQ